MLDDPCSLQADEGKVTWSRNAKLSERLIQDDWLIECLKALATFEISYSEPSYIELGRFFSFFCIERVK